MSACYRVAGSGGRDDEAPAQGRGFKRVPTKRLLVRLFVLALVLELLDGDVRDHRAKLLGRLEHGDRAGRHLDRRTGAGVAGHAGLAMADLEGPEAAHLDVLLLLERLLDGVQK